MEIREGFKNEKNLVLLLTQYQELFGRVNEYSSQLRKGILTDNCYLTDGAMKELAGIFMSLNSVCYIGEIEVSFKESKQFKKMRIEKEGIGEKPSVSLISKEADIEIIEFQRALALFKSYRDNCDRAISVLQSSLKGLGKEKGLPQD